MGEAVALVCVVVQQLMPRRWTPQARQHSDRNSFRNGSSVVHRTTNDGQYKPGTAPHRKTPRDSRICAVILRLLIFLTLCAPFAASAADIPRPEFPEPQFERPDWLTLNGPWGFAFDDANAGLDNHWYAGVQKFEKQIAIPYCFESKLSGINDTGFHPWAWYSRTITLPADWQTRRVLLHFGAVDYQAMVWVNGQLAGSHEGGQMAAIMYSLLGTCKLQGIDSHVWLADVLSRIKTQPEDKLIDLLPQRWKPACHQQPTQ